MMFWWSAASVAAKMDRLRLSEAKLLALSKLYRPSVMKNDGSPLLRAVDTKIARSAVPVSTGGLLTCTSGSGNATDDDDDSYVIHSIEVTASQTSDSNSFAITTDTPLVLLHGYMNGGVYFYRNFDSLSRYFRSIHALDLLGWGLSSRPSFSGIQTTAAAESFFVESLEAWREAKQIDKMILAGHSMGGYLSVAYCERYPERVERLILLSPVGVPKEDEEELRKRKAIRDQTWRWRARMMYNVYHSLFQYQTVGDVLRKLPTDRAKQFVTGYSSRRLGFATEDELNVFIDYLFENNTLPGSGEYCVNRILQPNVLAKEPLQDRIPKLQHVKSISFLYGAQDWMDLTGGLKVREEIARQKELQQQQSSPPLPDVDVYRVSNAGHLLMLEQPEQVSAGIILSAAAPQDQPAVIQALSLSKTLLPSKLTLAQYQQELAQATEAEIAKEMRARWQRPPQPPTHVQPQGPQQPPVQRDQEVAAA